jgi:hypothetical protein
MKKLNCWEFMQCGRQPGGDKVKELGACPVTLNEDLDGAHGGIGAGRVCWAIVGSLCNGKIQGTYAEKLKDCGKCEFMALVRREEELSPLGFTTSRQAIEQTFKKQVKKKKSV